MGQYYVPWDALNLGVSATKYQQREVIVQGILPLHVEGLNLVQKLFRYCSWDVCGRRTDVMGYVL